jgi:hypothetical protein
MLQRMQLIQNSQRHFLYSSGQPWHLKDEVPPPSTYNISNKKKALTPVWSDKSAVQGGT